MENASKALIIAGAILLSILLISLGIMVYTNAKGTIGETNLNSEEIQTFNTKISQYCGKNKGAEDMNSLISTIAALNGSQSKLADKHCVSFKITLEKDVSTNYYTGEWEIEFDSKGKATNSQKMVVTAIKYPTFSKGVKYSATYDTDNNGYINKVTINLSK